MTFKGLSLGLLGNLVGLLAFPSGSRNPGSLPDLTGDWDTNHGVVYLDQKGDRVTAEFDFQGKRDNRLEGILRGTVLEVTLTQPSFPPPLAARF